MSGPSSFKADEDGLAEALALLLDPPSSSLTLDGLGRRLPVDGLGERATLARLAPHILDESADLGAPEALAHMDPPTPWITWAMALWNASRNQNLLHPATAPKARQIEAIVVDWLAPFFGMDGGHMTSGSTLANITALWAAREISGVKRVVTSESAHLSIGKAAHLLGLGIETVPVCLEGSIRPECLPSDLGDACLVLTAGTTATGAIDPLIPETEAAWVHVDAAWAGPLRLSARHAHRLDGVERAHSVAVSAHKWLFQPKESALIFFKDTEKAHAAISFGGAYLAAPNIGLLGSHGASAVPLLATLIAFGQSGIAGLLDASMDVADRLADAIQSNEALTLLKRPSSGVVNWRPKDAARFEAIAAQLPEGFASTTTIDGHPWFRHAAANPNSSMTSGVTTAFTFDRLR